MVHQFGKPFIQLSFAFPHEEPIEDAGDSAQQGPLAVPVECKDRAENESPALAETAGGKAVRELVQP